MPRDGGSRHSLPDWAAKSGQGCMHMKRITAFAELISVVIVSGCALRAIDVRAVAAPVTTLKLQENTALAKRYEVPLVEPGQCSAHTRVSAPILASDLVDADRINAIVGYLASATPAVCTCIREAADAATVVVELELPGGGGKGTVRVTPDTAVGPCIAGKLDVVSLAAGVTPIVVHYEYKMPESALIFGSAGKASERPLSRPTPAPSVEPPLDAKRMASGLAYEILASPSRIPARPDTVRLRYHGWDKDGNEVASAQDEVLTISELVPGVAEGLLLLREGEKVRLFIPEALARAGKPTINTPGPLVFEVELLRVLLQHELPSARPERRSSSAPAGGSAGPLANERGGPSFGADLGYSRLLSGDGMNGFGFDVVGGYELNIGLIIEGQIGLHRFADTVSVSAGGMTGSLTTTVLLVPIFAGVRYRFDLLPFRPFVGAHTGFGRVSVSTDDVGDSVTKLGMNIGGGGDFAINDTVGLGAALWYTRILTDNEPAEMLQFSLDLRFSP